MLWRGFREFCQVFTPGVEVLTLDCLRSSASDASAVWTAQVVILTEDATWLVAARKNILFAGCPGGSTARHEVSLSGERKAGTVRLGRWLVGQCYC